MDGVESNGVCVYVYSVRVISTFSIKIYICLNSNADNCGCICVRMGV